jgi:hypothetical protein
MAAQRLTAVSHDIQAKNYLSGKRQGESTRKILHVLIIQSSRNIERNGGFLRWSMPLLYAILVANSESLYGVTPSTAKGLSANAEIPRFARNDTSWIKLDTVG